MTKTKKQKPEQTAQEKDLERAKDQAKTQYECIADMVKALNGTHGEDSLEDDEAREAAIQAIQEDPLSVEVRSGWRVPGAGQDGAEEYKILLCTGGPAVQIIGDLDQHGEPETAALQYQDWFTPWVTFPLTSEQEKTLLTYARQFYFGE